MITNNFWNNYPTIADSVPETFKEEHPRLTNNSNIEFEMGCPKCTEKFITCPKDFLQTGFCPICKDYLVDLEKSMLKNATIDTIIASESIDDYLNNLKKFKPIELGYIQEFFAFLFFNVHRHLFNIKEYISYSFTKDKSLIEELGLPNKDLGSDAIIIHDDKSVSLVQVKWRSNQSCMNRSVFNGMSTDALQCNTEIRHLILFSNSVEIAKTLPVGEKFKYFLYNNLLEINWEFFKSGVQSFKETKEIVATAPEIVYRDWQIEAYKFVKQQEKVCTVVAPCGAGKTLFGHKVFKKMEKYNVLILVPSLQLLSQWFYTLSVYEKDTEFLLIGSQHEDDGSDVPFTLTTDPITIIDVMENRGDKIVTICTYQSFNILYDIGYEYSLTFADEAHVTAGSSTSSFTLVHNKNFKTTKKIFLTATPRVYKGKMVQKCISMNDKEKFGEQFTCSCRRAIEDKILCDYQVIFGHCKIKSGFPDENRFDLYAKLLCISIKDYNLTKILVASGNHASSEKFYNIFQDIYRGNIPSVLMKPNAKAREKNKVLADINNNPLIIFNVKVFNVGVDIPTLQAVFFNGDKSSKIDIVQTAMRCLRFHKDKKQSYIIVPSFCNEDNLDNEDEVGDYPMVRNTLSALGAQDSAIFDELVIRSEKARQGKTVTNKSTNRIQFVPISDEEDKIDIHNIETKLFNRLGEIDIVSWMIRYNEVKEYVKNNGKYPSKKECSWVFKQRHLYKMGKLSQEKIELLEMLLNWTWDFHKEQWLTAYKQYKKCIDSKIQLTKEQKKWRTRQRVRYAEDNLSDYKIKLMEQINGWKWDYKEETWLENYKQVRRCLNLNIKMSSDLVSWCENQKYNYKHGKLSEKRIKLLESIQNWAWGNAKEARWFAKYYKVVKYYNVNLNDTPPEQLSKWMGRQRYFYKKGKLSQERINLIEKIKGWTWNPKSITKLLIRYEKMWKTRFDELKTYLYENEGKYPRARDKIGMWIRLQRDNYKNGKLTDDQIKQLETLPGWKWVGNLNKS